MGTGLGPPDNSRKRLKMYYYRIGEQLKDSDSSRFSQKIIGETSRSIKMDSRHLVEFSKTKPNAD